MEIATLAFLVTSFIIALVFVSPTEENIKKYKALYRVRKVTFNNGVIKYFVEHKYMRFGSWDRILVTPIEEEALELCKRRTEIEEDRLENIKNSKIIKSEIIK